jgi:hypothetical protein
MTMVRIIEDEIPWNYSVEHSSAGIQADIPQDTLDWIERVETEYAAVQEYLQTMHRNACGAHDA